MWINISGDNKITGCCDFVVQFFLLYIYKHFIHPIPCDIVFIPHVIYTAFLTGYGPTVTILLLCIFCIDLGYTAAIGAAVSQVNTPYLQHHLTS